jgi:prostaglandin-endoperoxide synthase 2
MPEGSSLGRRDTSRDGFRNKFQAFVLSHGRAIWRFVNGWPWLARIANRAIVSNAALKAPTRPLRLTTKADYPSWSSLTDKTYFARYLPPRDSAGLPPLEALERLYVTRPSGPRLSDRSTLLFPSFAQWFTDGFLMTDPNDSRRTTCNHQIDLSQIYGLNVTVEAQLREHSETPGHRGRLLSDTVNGEEWAPRLFHPDGTRDGRFAAVPDPVKMPDTLPLDRKATIFAFGGERANATVFTAALNTLFLREHNRLCAEIGKAHPDFDDERLFQTARAVNIVQLIKVVVEEYINHITPFWFKLLADPTPCYTATWNRENWIPVEFNLLYRWHSLVPEITKWRGADFPMADARFGNAPMIRDGLGAALDAASTSVAWRVGLFNTAEMLRAVEAASVKQGRTNRLASYNDYREVMHYPRVTRFEQITGDPDVVRALRDLYGNVDQVEFFVGLFAEDAHERSAMPRLIGRMVAADAFSHALTNPLLAPKIFREDTFTPTGWSSIGATSTLADVADRNLPNGARAWRICMDHPEHDSVA